MTPSGAHLTKGWLLLAAVALLLGCSASAAEYYRDESTEQMDTYPESLLTYDTGLERWSYGDPEVEVHLSLSGGDVDALKALLVNKTGQPVAVPWNRGRFVDAMGRQWRIINDQVDYWALAQDQRASTIAPFDQGTYLLQPARLVQRDGGPRLAPLPTEALSEGWDGQVRLLLPIQAMGRVRLYRFRFDPSQLEDPQPLFSP